MSNIGHGLFNGVEKQAKTWWSTLWGGVSDSLDSGASSSTLVNAMEKYGATNKYVYGAEGPSAFDCSGLVEYTLKKLGISFPRTSGEQYKASKYVSNPKPGDLVFFGPGGSDHVGVYTGNGEFYSAENEKMVWVSVKCTAVAMGRLLVMDVYPVYQIALAQISLLNLVAC